jgi:hypothetical protein
MLALLKKRQTSYFAMFTEKTGCEAFDGVQNDQTRQLQHTLWPATSRPRPEYALFQEPGEVERSCSKESKRPPSKQAMGEQKQRTLMADFDTSSFHSHENGENQL